MWPIRHLGTLPSYNNFEVSRLLDQHLVIFEPIEGVWNVWGAPWKQSRGFCRNSWRTQEPTTREWFFVEWVPLQTGSRSPKNIWEEQAGLQKYVVLPNTTFRLHKRMAECGRNIVHTVPRAWLKSILSMISECNTQGVHYFQDSQWALCNCR